MKRYEFNHEENYMDESKCGDYVKFDDVSDLVSTINNLIPYIGKKVCKCAWYRGKPRVKNRNVKPFKSGRFTNTVKGIILHPILNIPSFTFEEDDSYVECRRCMIVDENEKFKDEECLEQKYGFNWYKIVNGRDTKAKRYQVLENGEPAVMFGSDTFSNCIFDTFEKAKNYLFFWAFPVNEEVAKILASNADVELNVPFDCSQGEFPVIMEIREVE